MFLSNSLSKARYLITGAFGQLGIPLSRELRARYGPNSVIASGLNLNSSSAASIIKEGPTIQLDVCKPYEVEEIVKKEKITSIIHLAALLSAIAEENLDTAVKVNINSIYSMLKIATKYNCQVFIPSTIGAFGPDSPRDFTPDVCVQRPKTIYGISKVYSELLGEYFNVKYGVDFRCLRFPGIISADSPPGGGTTDYAIDIFHHALKTANYNCYLTSDTMLPMMHIDDCINGTIKFLETDNTFLKKRTYNIAAISFTPKEIAEAIKIHIPQFQLTESIDPVRQSIADSWPKSFDDSGAKKDWNWSHSYNLDSIVSYMLDSLRNKKSGKPKSSSAH